MARLDEDLARRVLDETSGSDLDERLRQLVGPFEEERAVLMARKEGLQNEIGRCNADISKLDRMLRVANPEAYTASGLRVEEVEAKERARQAAGKAPDRRRLPLKERQTSHQRQRPKQETYDEVARILKERFSTGEEFKTGQVVAYASASQDPVRRALHVMREEGLIGFGKKIPGGSRAWRVMPGAFEDEG